MTSECVSKQHTSFCCVYMIHITVKQKVISIWIQVISVAVANDFTMQIAMTYLEIEEPS